jgi:hypothetical protein
MIAPKIINAKIKGNNTSNHEIVECPSLHIKLSTHVQNKIYNNLPTKIIRVLGTLHE